MIGPVEVSTAGRRGRRACRCSPCRPAGSRRGSGACTGRTAGWRASGRRRSSLYHTPSRPKHRRQVLLERRGAEVLVHRVARRQQLLEVVHADRAPRWAARWPPERVAAADPVPEAEHVGRVDAELLHLGSSVDSATKCLAHGCLSFRPSRNQSRAECALVSVSCVVNVLEAMMKSVVSGSSFLSGLDDVRAVDVGDEVRAQPRLPVGLKRLGGHDGAEVGAADADVHDVGDRLPV